VATGKGGEGDSAPAALCRGDIWRGKIWNSKIVVTRCQNAPNSISAGAPPLTPLGDVTAPPDLLPEFKGEGAGER